MKAAVFHEHGGPEVLRIEEFPDPVAGPTEALIRVHATSVNHLDLWVRRGLPFDIPMPHIGGSDIAGVVEAVGSLGDEGWIGKRVVVDPSVAYDWYDRAAHPLGAPKPFQVIGEHTQGGMAELAVVPAANLVELPGEVEFDTAAAGALAGVTAWRALMTRGGLVPGQLVLVTGGSGGVSTMAIQYAVLSGARVHAITSGPENVDRVKALGAEAVYDRLEEGWEKELWRGTDKLGFNLCIDSVGPALYSTVIRCMGVGGTVVSYGSTSGSTADVDLRHVFWKQLSILGSTMGTPSEFRQAMDPVFRGQVVPPVFDRLPLDAARTAHETLEQGRVFGKLILHPQS